MTQPTSEDPNYKPEALSRALLEHHVYDFDAREDGLPKRIDPNLVQKYILEELDKGRPSPTAAFRMTELADFYGTRDVLPRMIQWLDQREESVDDIDSSASLTWLIGILGTGTEKGFGRSYYHYLLGRPESEHKMEELFRVFVAYAPEETSALTLARLDALIAKLGGGKDPDDDEDEPETATAAREMEDLKNVRFRRIEAAVALRAQILQMPDRDARLDVYTAMYLGIDMRYFTELSRWAPRMLMNEASGGHKPQVIDAFRRALGKLDPKDPSLAARRPRAVHAIEFFGAVLSPEEKAELRPDLKLRDLLSTD